MVDPSGTDATLDQLFLKAIRGDARSWNRIKEAIPVHIDLAFQLMILVERSKTGWFLARQGTLADWECLAYDLRIACWLPHLGLKPAGARKGRELETLLPLEITVALGRLHAIFSMKEVRAVAKTLDRLPQLEARDLVYDKLRQSKDKLADEGKRWRDRGFTDLETIAGILTLEQARRQGSYAWRVQGDALMEQRRKLQQ